MRTIFGRGRSHGNVIVLTCVLAWLILLGLAVGMCFTSLFVTHYAAQSVANEIAMAAAQVLNHNDREGQMNNMISRNRQLVFASRELHDWVAKELPSRELLAAQLLRETQDGARILEEERVHLVEVVQSEAKEEALKRLADLKSRTNINLPWVQTGVAEISGLSLGFVDGIDANVEAPAGLPELIELDRKNHYAQSRSNLYRGNVNAKLPASDAYLDFNLASLPAPVKKSISPARLIMFGDFRDHLLPHLPSAAKVQLVVSVATKIGAQTKNTFSVTGCAAGCGALDERVTESL